MAAVSLVNKTPTRSLLAGNTGWLTGYEHIQSITVGAGGTSSVSFTEIPQGYRHLQIRGTVLTNRGTYGIDDVFIQFNGDNASNYARHRLYGNGSSAASDNATSQTAMVGITVGTTVTNYPGCFVMDVLDYSSTVKNKTIRVLGGVDINGTVSSFGGVAGIVSGLWMNTAAVNAVRFSPANGTLLTQYTTFSLYGVR